MYLIFVTKKRGVDTVATVLLTEQGAANVATAVKTNPGVGKPYLVFDNLPDGNPTGVDFTGAPIANVDVAVNQTAIDDMLANPPWDALTY